jgi:hypothetical protein
MLNSYVRITTAALYWLPLGKVCRVEHTVNRGVAVLDSRGLPIVLWHTQYVPVFAPPPIPDLRKDRHEHPLDRRGSDRGTRRVVARTLSKQFKAVREDRRFAIPALVSACDKHGFGRSCIPRRFRHAFPLDSVPSHDAIPECARRFAGARPSSTDAGKIACWPTVADMKRNREIVMAPGRFFAAVYPHATPSEVQAMAESYANHTRPPVVHFADDADDWCRVYASARGFSSCMAGTWDKPQRINPIRFYVYPDNGLRLAYLTHNNKPDGETVARCIVNVKKKLAVRIYGDARLHIALDSLGYRVDAYGALSRVKCAAIVKQNHDLVAPYLDGVGRVEWDGSSEWCRIADDGNYDAQNTDGTASEDDDRASCDECGERTYDDELIYSSFEECSICQSCCDRHFTFAIVDRRGNEDYVRDHNVTHINGAAYLDDSEVLSSHGFVLCGDNEWRHEDDVIYLDYCEEYYAVDDCVRLNISHGHDNYAHELDVIQITLDGETLTVHEDYDGDTDEKIAARVAAARRNARRVRTFSRAPQRRRARRNVGKRIAK